MSGGVRRCSWLLRWPHRHHRAVVSGVQPARFDVWWLLFFSVVRRRWSWAWEMRKAGLPGRWIAYLSSSVSISKQDKLLGEVAPLSNFSSWSALEHLTRAEAEGRGAIRFDRGSSSATLNSSYSYIILCDIDMDTEFDIVLTLMIILICPTNTIFLIFYSFHSQHKET